MTILRSATRFDQENWFQMVIDKDVPSCEVTGELDDVPVSFFGNEEEGLIIGGTLFWNQYIFNPSVVNSQVALAEGSELISGHKYLIICNGEVSDESVGHLLYLYGKQNGESIINALRVLNLNNNRNASIVSLNVNATADGKVNNDNSIWLYLQNDESVVNGSLNFVDLTLLFGSEVADTLYNIENSNAGAGVAIFKKLFSFDYYAYNAGTEKTLTLR